LGRKSYGGAKLQCACSLYGSGLDKSLYDIRAARQLNETIQGFELFSQQAEGKRTKGTHRRTSALYHLYIKGQKSEKAYNSENSIILDDSNKSKETANTLAIYTQPLRDDAR
jgi:hypothetical protein